MESGQNDLYFPQRQGQVLECEWTETGNTLDTPAYAWTFPSENAFIIAYGPQDSTFATLSTWWTNHADPAGGADSRGVTIVMIQTWLRGTRRTFRRRE